MILADAEFCQSQAGSFGHFAFLMKRIGYQFEYGKYLSVKVPGGKWYHELGKLDELKAEKKALNRKLRIAEGCAEDRISF